MIVLSTVLLVGGTLFLVASTLGLFRLPDLFTRAHAVAMSETVGVALVFGGLLLRPELTADAAPRLLLVLLLSLVANPTGVHALVRAAYRSGVAPFRVSGPDEAGSDMQGAAGDQQIAPLSPPREDQP